MPQEAEAPDEPKVPPPPTAPDKPKAADQRKDATLELYVSLVPFIQHSSGSGATPNGFVEAPGHIGVASASYNGVNPAPRLHMSAGTSHLGVRGSLRLFEQLTVLGQIETGMPIDGDPNPWELDLPNRNSYLGVKGDWGTLAVGRIDTPYKWITLTTINPFKAGYIADYTAIIGTPGFLVNAIPHTSRWQQGDSVSNSAFYRREANGIQYWSPILWGFHARFGYVTNEHRLNDDAFSVRSNPYIVSAAGGFDFEGLRLRYAWENHHDYFGLAQVSQFTVVPSQVTRTADDYGNTGVAQYTLTAIPNLTTRIAGIFEYLKYTTEASAPGEVNRYERPAFYALLEQSVFQHHLWGAYGRAYSGKCGRAPPAGGPPATCSTAHVGAQLISAGYMFKFNESAQAFLAAYRLVNERSGTYVTTPTPTLREGISPGIDWTGVGIGFHYAFGADLL